jgi:hypothetical protein
VRGLRISIYWRKTAREKTAGEKTVGEKTAGDNLTERIILKMNFQK